jgi:hypothetical protein
MLRVHPRGFMCVGSPGPRRRPRAETFSGVGYGAGAACHGGSLQAQGITYAATSEGGGRTRSRQVLRGSQHTLQPGMIGGQGSIGGSTEVKGSLGASVAAMLRGGSE